tara:strand:+ start:214 stop:414 length:201 start_codon:yes stop_codon:yes gene_type:complete
MRNKIINKIIYEYPKPNFIKAQLIKLFEWILGGTFKDNKQTDREIDIFIKTHKYNYPNYKYDINKY